MAKKLNSAYIIHKADGTLVVRPSITLKPGRDNDLIQALEAAVRTGTSVAVFFREAMRSGLTGQQVTAIADKAHEVDLLQMMDGFDWDDEE